MVTYTKLLAPFSESWQNRFQRLNTQNRPEHIRCCSIFSKLLYARIYLAGDLVQLDYPARPITPGEEEIMRIYEDGVYRPQDMIGRPEGFQIRRFSVRPE